MQHRSTAWALAILLVFPFAFAFRGQAQTSSNAISRFDRRITPPSPEATQLGVFGSAPPDLHTGAIQTTVPLLEVKSRQLSLAVALNYHYTGLQVAEVPSWVGLGWTLSAGGVITRTVQGLPDELGAGMGYCKGAWSTLRLHRLRTSNNGPLAVTLIGTNTNVNKADFCQRVTEGAYDSEPDAYTISTPFYSGKLFLDSVGVISCSPHSDVRFSGSPAGNWTATTGDGTVYEYTAAERTAPIIVDATSGAIPAITAWHLSSIISADGTDRIDLGYGSGQSPNAVPSAYTLTREAYRQFPPNYTECNTQLPQYVSLPNVAASTWGGPNVNLSTSWLTTITTATTQVELISDNIRSDVDLSGDRPARRLLQVISRDIASQQPKTQYDLTYEYFNVNGAAKAKRLCLKEVKESGKPSYVFTYDTSVGIPSRESFARDHWGYYNGQPNTTLMPVLPPIFKDYSTATGIGGNTGANRASNGVFAKAGALTRIQYPTGGWTQFAYEPNITTIRRNYVSLALQKFGGVNLDLPITRYYAEALGGSWFHNNRMGDWELTYASTHVPPFNAGDGTTATPRPLQNVGAARIDAKTGFILNDIRCTGRVTTTMTPPSSGCASLFEGPVTVFLYRVNAADTTQLDRLCKVDYGIGTQYSSTAPQCTTSINRTSSDALRYQHFAAGRYYLVAEVNSNNSVVTAAVSADLIFDPSTTTPQDLVPLQVGGIRLAKTIDRTGAGDSITKTYWYRQPVSEGGASSGFLFSEPEYAYMRPCSEVVVSASDLGKTNWLDAGYHIGYGRVEVESTGRQAGTTVYYYVNDDGYGANCRSLLTKVEELSATGALVKQTTNSYKYEAIASSPGFRLTKEYDVITTAAGVNTPKEVHFWFAPRSYTSYWPKLVRTVEQVFASGTAGLSSKTTDYTYLARSAQSTTQPIRVAKLGTNGQWQVTSTRYPGQYGLPLNTAGLSGAPALGLAALVEKHLVSLPVEHQHWIRTGADSVVIGGDVTHFTGLRPARIFALTLTAPLLPSQFLSSQVQGTFQQDARYIERVAFPLYSTMGSLLQQRVAQAPPSSYLWGHAETKLIAEAQNASYSQIAFTSFENDASGSWEYNGLKVVTTAAFTGTRAYQLDTSTGTMQRLSLPAGEYDLVLWKQGTNLPQITGPSTMRSELLATAGLWHQYRYRLSMPTNATLQLSGAPGLPLLVDEVRLAPVGAQLTTYTYDPLVGMTSQTDPSGRTTTYEYDAVGRLVRTRDEQGRLLSQQEYHYARPQ